MAKHNSGPFQIFQARRRTSRRIPFLIVAGVALLFIILDQSGVQAVRALRIGILEAASPMVEQLSKPVYFVRNIFENLQHLAELRTENEYLRDRVVDLTHQLADVEIIRSENKVLREQLNFIPHESFGFITAPVIADSSGVFARSVIVKAGSQAGVRKGQAVITGDGLIGRTHEVGPRTTRVILLQDLSSRVPVMLLSTRDRAVLAGNNSQRPTLLYLPEGAEVKLGDKIVTSGDGGVFPHGIPIGSIAGRVGSELRVDLLSDVNRLDYVKIVDYGLTGLVEGVDKE